MVEKLGDRGRALNTAGLILAIGGGVALVGGDVWAIVSSVNRKALFPRHRSPRKKTQIGVQQVPEKKPKERCSMDLPGHGQAAVSVTCLQAQGVWQQGLDSVWTVYGPGGHRETLPGSTQSGQQVGEHGRTQ